ncbi:TonB-dependent receptor [Microbulbifer halophilus]|uniref:TonB-dependent receptor n=2 Tax=Microbulbifer halophilus TaxID=453963 RepID=A0ABW5EH53_9GAMM|nr:TonB-dependent receptor [Microbulbifer halophilus]MCW8126947.1 TonB-dependent receptor [Microbulbifer halophilus]
MYSSHNPSQRFHKTLLATAVTLLSVNVQAQDSDTLEEVMVTGIRGSLQQSLDVKRDATSIVDAINSEDIGKFPDKNVADSLQRVPGISVDRIWGEGRDIFVRGTDSTLNRTLMNGQNVASAYWWANDNPSRGFNYSILASELVSSLEVYKSPEARHDEGSIGGMVNVRTRKPMDLDPLTVNLSTEGVYSDLPGEWDPQVSGLLSWKNDTETFGVLASFNSQGRTMRRDGLEVFPTNDLYTVTDQNGNTTENVYVPWGGGSAIFNQDRQRDTANITLQFRPTDRWDTTLNYVASDMEMDNSNQNYLFVAGGYKIPNGDTVTDPVFIPTSDGNRALVGGTIENPDSIGVADEPIVRESFIESEVLDLAADYEGDGWQLHLQAGTTSAEGGSTKDRNYWFEGNGAEELNFGPDTNEFNFPGIDPLDGTALHLNAANLRDWVRVMEDDESYFQVDGSFDLELGFITGIRTGLKLRDHTIENNRQDGSVDVANPEIADQVATLNAITLADVSSGPSPELHGESASAESLTRYAFMDVGLARQKIDSILDSGVMTYDEDTRAYYKIDEEITAGYVQAEFERGRLHGNFGVRLVETDQTSNAYIDGERGSVGRSYREALPSVNAIYDLGEDIILRAAASRAMARPTFQNLSSNIVINATSGTATAGNPQLDPMFADQFEFGAEWYFGDASLLAATYFNKDLSTFVFQDTQVEEIDGESINVTRPYNADRGADIQGIELQVQHDFGSGFGALTNYTWTDAEAPANEDGTRLELPGNSRDQFNASAYYENDTFSVRLSYNMRSKSYGGLTSGSQLVTEKYDQWDATANWTATENVDVFLTAVNLTNEIIYMRTADGIPTGFYENGPRYSLGAHLSF